METLNDKLKVSADRISAQGAQFLGATRGAGGSFVNRARSAGEAFWGETRSASGELVSTTVDAQRELRDIVQLELETWLSHLRAETTRLSTSTAEAKLPTIRGVEVRVLSSLDAGLKNLEALVQQRLEERGEPLLPSTTPATVHAEAPLAGYDDLTAKEVVARAQELDPQTRKGILAYERRTKKRSTVISALETKLEA